MPVSPCVAALSPPFALAFFVREALGQITYREVQGHGNWYIRPPLLGGELRERNTRLHFSGHLGSAACTVPSCLLLVLCACIYNALVISA